MKMKKNTECVDAYGKLQNKGRKIENIIAMWKFNVIVIITSIFPLSNIKKS